MRCLINHLKLPPFIATLATMAGLRSLASVLSNNHTITVSYDTYRFLGSKHWVTLSVFAAVAVATEHHDGLARSWAVTSTPWAVTSPRLG